MNIQTSDSEQMRKELQRRVFSAVAHDVKTPLASIIGALQVLEQMSDKLTTEQMNALLQTALQEARRLDDFFTTLLAAEKPD